MQETEIFYPKDVNEWKNWLIKNHASKDSVWVVFYNKKSGKPSITWSESVEVALCYGWIDSKKIAIDKERSHQFFSKRRAKSTWSKINKDKVEQLIANGLMTKAGLETIEVAKKNGSWTLLDEVEQLIIPADLLQAFEQKPGTKEYFDSLSKSARKVMLQRLVLAKQETTRQKRINEIIQIAAQEQKPG